MSTLPRPRERQVQHVASIRDTPGIQHLNPACHLAAYYVYLWLRDDCHAGDVDISELIGALNPDQLATHVRRRLPNFELPENPTNETWRRAWRMLCAHTLGWKKKESREEEEEEGDQDRFNARVNIFLHTHFFPDDNTNNNALVSHEVTATPKQQRRRHHDLRSSHELRAFQHLWLDPLPPPPTFKFPDDAWVTPVSLPLYPESPELESPRQCSNPAAPQHSGFRSPRKSPDWMSYTNDAASTVSETCEDYNMNLPRHCNPAAPRHTGSQSPRKLPDGMISCTNDAASSAVSETCDDYNMNLPTKIHSTFPSTSRRPCVRRCTRDPCTHLPYKTTKW